MAVVLFHEKPGCINNTRQKGILLAMGHEVIARDLLSGAWSPARLRPYLAQLPVAQWFNASAPRVKSGEIDPHALSEELALQLMCRDPLLIRRPLIAVDGQCMAGFDPCDLLHRLGVVFDIDQDLQSCPRTHSEQACVMPEAAHG